MRASSAGRHMYIAPASNTVEVARGPYSGRTGSSCRFVRRFRVIVDGGNSRRRFISMSTRPMFSGHTGSQAPHSVQDSIDGARSATLAPCCMALARPWGVRRRSRVRRHTGHTSRHRLQPLHAAWSCLAARAPIADPNIRKSRRG